MHNDVLRLEENNPSSYPVPELNFTNSCQYFFKYLFYFLYGTSELQFGFIEHLGKITVYLSISEKMRSILF